MLKLLARLIIPEDRVLFTSLHLVKAFEGQALMEGGHNLPPERSAELVLQLASGRADILSGRFLDITDDIDALIARVEEIKRDDLYTMRLRT